MSIPRILHLYWGRNQPLSYMRALTIKTFQALNPEWEVKLWISKYASTHSNWKTGEHPCHYRGYDHLQDLEDYCHVFDFESVGIPANLPEVHKSDLLRWYLLGTEGGIWSDMDIIYSRPITKNMEDNWRGAGLCKYEAQRNNDKEFQAIGFLTSEGPWGALFFTQLFNHGLSRIYKGMGYQAFGADLLTDFLENWKSKARTPFYHNPDLVYFYHTCFDMKRYFEPTGLPMKLACLGFHWYAGNPGVSKLEARITQDNIRDMAKYHVICREALKICP